MPTRRLSFLFVALGVLLILSVVALWPTQKAQAQCGSQASSCKTCHETQAQKAVNTDGTGWHTGHAFGDFCYSCHGGNNQSMVKEESHVGMTPPMADVKMACSGCHPDDLQERAQKYADALGVSLSGGGAATTGAAATGAATPQATVAPAAAPISGQDIGGQAPGAPAAPAPGGPASGGPASGGPAPMVVNAAAPAQEIDYVARYNGETPINWGNLILVGLIVLVAVSGGGLVYWNERRLRGLPLIPPSRSAARSAELPKVPGYPDEVVALLPKLARLNPVGLHALKRILENPDHANEMLPCLSHLDPDLIQRVSSLDRDSRSLLLALAGD